MKVLLDTHLLLWAAVEPHKLPKIVGELLHRGDVQPVFSAASIWEVAIKAGLKKPDFQIEPPVFYTGLLKNGYEELPVSSLHTLLVSNLPAFHNDPFDRLLIAQAQVEGLLLLTSDSQVAKYSGTYLV